MARQYYCRKWDLEKKNNWHPTITENKCILASLYSTTAWDLSKIQSTFELHRNKYIFSFLTTVLLWCIGHRKNLIGPDPHRKKNIFSSVEIKSSKYLGRKALKQLDERNSEHLRVLGDLKQDIQNLRKGSDGVAVKIPSKVQDHDLADIENLVKECADREQDLIRIQNLSKDLVCPSKFRKIKSKRKKSVGRNVEDIKVSKILEKKNSTFPNDEEAADENGSIAVKPRTKRPCEVERIPSVNEEKVIADN